MCRGRKGSRDDRNFRGRDGSKNVDERAAEAAIDVLDSREVDRLEMAQDLARQARAAEVVLARQGGSPKAMTKSSGDANVA